MELRDRDVSNLLMEEFPPEADGDRSHVVTRAFIVHAESIVPSLAPGRNAQGKTKALFFCPFSQTIRPYY